jgi:hypothetical protein
MRFASRRAKTRDRKQVTGIALGSLGRQPGVCIRHNLGEVGEGPWPIFSASEFSLGASFQWEPVFPVLNAPGFEHNAKCFRFNCLLCRVSGVQKILHLIAQVRGAQALLTHQPHHVDIV